MIRPEIFLTAAVWLDEVSPLRAHGCCSALRMAGARSGERQLFYDLFPLNRAHTSWGDASNHSAAQHEARVLALLFCWAEALDL